MVNVNKSAVKCPYTSVLIPNTLTILAGKSCISLNSVQGMAGWLPLVFFIYLHNQLSSIHSIIMY